MFDLNSIGLLGGGMGLLGGGGFSPTDIDGLQFWITDTDFYEDTAGNTVAADDGDAIARQDDQAGSNNVVQATTADRATLKLATVNSLDVVRYDGSSDHLHDSSPSIASAEYTVFMVIVPRSGGTDTQNPFRCRPLGGYGTASGIAFGWGGDGGGGWDWNSGISPIEDDSGNAYTLDEASAPTLTQNTADIIAFQFGSSSAEAWKNGTSTGTSITVRNGSLPLGTITLPEIVIAASEVSSPNRFFNGDVCEILLYNSLLSNADMNRIGNYLERWGPTWSDIT